MIAMDDFLELQRRVEELKRRRAKVEGQLEEVGRQLLERHGCPDVAAARKKLQNLEKEERQQAEGYMKAKKAFDDKWHDVLEASDGQARS